MVRNNIFNLVKHGFTREELWFMPINEVRDYVKLLNDNIAAQEEAAANAERQVGGSSINDIRFGGNSI